MSLLDLVIRRDLLARSKSLFAEGLYFTLAFTHLKQLHASLDFAPSLIQRMLVLYVGVLLPALDVLTNALEFLYFLFKFILQLLALRRCGLLLLLLLLQLLEFKVNARKGLHTLINPL